MACVDHRPLVLLAKGSLQDCMGERAEPRSPAAVFERREGMLNKELHMRNTGGQQPVALTVGSYRISGPYFYYGYDRGRIGALAPVPFWDNNAHLSTLRYDNQNNRTTCAATDRSVNLTVYISGYQDSPISSGESISGDPFRFTVKVGQTVYLTFDPPYRISIRKSSRYLPALKRRAW